MLSAKFWRYLGLLVTTLPLLIMLLSAKYLNMVVSAADGQGLEIAGEPMSNLRLIALNYKYVVWFAYLCSACLVWFWLRPSPVDASKRRAWIAAFLLASPVANPVFWYKYVVQKQLQR